MQSTGLRFSADRTLGFFIDEQPGERTCRGSPLSIEAPSLSPPSGTPDTRTYPHPACLTRSSHSMRERDSRSIESSEPRSALRVVPTDGKASLAQPLPAASHQRLASPCPPPPHPSFSLAPTAAWGRSDGRSRPQRRAWRGWDRSRGCGRVAGGRAWVAVGCCPSIGYGRWWHRRLPSSD